MTSIQRTVYGFTSGVRSAFLFAAVLMLLLVVTLPIGVYFFIKRNSARVSFDAGGFDVNGLGFPARWNFGDLERIGLLCIEVRSPLASVIDLNGGPVAVNLCARTKSGKNLKFMVSRFEDHQAIIDRLSVATGLPLEEVRIGAFGPAWPSAAVYTGKPSTG